MGLRFRKSFKIAPGVRVNIGKKSVGISAGIKDARISVNSKGRVTKSAGIPGTGISYVKTEQIEKKSTNKTTVTQTVPVEQSDTPAPTPPPKKSPSKLLKITSIFLIVTGIILAVADTIPALIMTLIGCWLLHHQYANTEAEKGLVPKRIYRRPWFIATILLFLFAVGSAESFTPSIEDIGVSASAPIKLSIPNKKELTYTYSPSDANVSNLSCAVSNPVLASAEIVSAEEGKVICLVTPLAVGDVSITCTSDNITSPAYNMSIHDPVAEEAERKAAEEAERKAAEEAERKAAEDAERKAAEEAKRKAAEATVAAQAAQSQQTQSPSQQASERTVYVTPSGKRWHLDPDCGGKNSFPISQANVGNRTACQKCAGG